MERYERLWERLLALLSTLGEVMQAPGRVIVTIEGRRIEVVMTEKEWDELVSIPYGSFAPAAEHVVFVLKVALDQAVPFLVYEDYDLHPSDVLELPDEWPEMHGRIDEARRANPDATFGWYSYSPDSHGSS